MFQSLSVDWFAGYLEETGLRDCSMEHSAPRGRKRKTEQVGEFVGGLSLCSTTAHMAGSWLNPLKLVLMTPEMRMELHGREMDESFKRAAADLPMGWWVQSEK